MARARIIGGGVTGSFDTGLNFGGGVSTGIPTYLAKGGMGRGLSIVGEEGREAVDSKNPYRVYSNDELGDALRGSAPAAGGDTYNIYQTNHFQTDVRNSVREEVLSVAPELESATLNAVADNVARRTAIGRAISG